MTVRTPGTLPNELPDDALIITEDDNPTMGSEIQAIIERFNVHQSFWGQIHVDGLSDDLFVKGKQWPDEIRKEREDDGRPMLTYNLLPAFNRQITNRMRQERPQIKVTPVQTNKGADPRVKNVTGTKDYSIADVYSGIIRNIEHVSRADQCYDTAAKHAVDHGFGFFYLMNQWSKFDPFVQELQIHRVKNSYTVYLDPDAQEADYRDGQDAFMFTRMKRSAFDLKYPDATPYEFAGPTTGTGYDGWYTTEDVRVAQYFKIENKDDEVLMLSNGTSVWLSQVKDVLDELEERTGIHIVKDSSGKEMRKKVKRPVCTWRLMTGAEYLEGPLELPFSAVPIFPVLGEEMVVDGVTSYESAVRHARDAQRSYNYWRTAAAETVALQPRAPYTVTPRQIAGHEQMYEDANRKNLPYLLYNHEDGAQPPQRNFPANPAAAELSNATQDGADMQAIIGLHDASLGKESNEKSGKAIIARQNQGATSTFQFPDNLGRAMEQMGRLIVEAVPQLYDTQRMIRIRFPDGSEDFVELNQTVVDEQSGETILVNDINVGRYDVVIETGPSYATQRQEAADLQMELLKVLGPDMARNIVHLIVQNLGVPGSDEVSAVLRKMLPDQLKSEEEKQADLPQGVTMNPETEQLEKDGEPWQPPLTPEQQLMQKQQQIDEAENNAKLAGAEADMAEAEADKMQANAKLKAAEVDMAKLGAELQQLQDGMGQQGGDPEMMKGIEEIIRTVMEEHEVNPDAHKEATSEMITEAVVDALTRVKGFVDKKMSETPPAAAVSRNGNADSVPGAAELPPAAAPAAPAAMNLNIEPKPDRINFEYDDQGNLIAGIPVYDGEESGE